MKGAIIVTIKDKLELFKNGELADRIELILLEEVGFELVAQKDLYSVGDSAVYIQPDFSLSENELFDGFMKPSGDYSKPLLGKIEGTPQRVRARKFNFSKKGELQPVYSNGILLPLDDVLNFLKISHISQINDLDSALGISKYEEPDIKSTGILRKKSFGTPIPSGIYKTDETNIYNLKGKLKFPLELYGSLKVDGSSITIGVIDNSPFISSRNVVKSVYVNKVVGQRKMKWYEHLMFWKDFDLNIYRMSLNSSDDFVKYGHPIVKRMIAIGMNDILLRGELNGEKVKGSGNKNNPSSKLPPNIKFFGMDKMESGVANRQEASILFDAVFKLGEDACPVILPIKTYESFEDIIKECDTYFKDNMVEGIVMRTRDSTLSFKVMNLEYDSKK